MQFKFQMDRSQFFFDQKGNPISKGFKKKEHVALNRFGAVLRKTGRNSMRYRKSKSAAGAPPSAHKKSPATPRGPLLREGILYAWDAQSRSVVSGPVLLRGAKGGNIPKLHEFGGTAVTRVRVDPPRKQGARRLTPKQKAAYLMCLKNGEIAKPSQIYRRVTANFPARPTMAPALKKSLPRAPGFYSNLISG